MDLALVISVITSPSAAFGRVRSGDYLVQAAWILAVSAAAGVLPLLPFAMIPIQADFDGMVDELALPTSGAEMMWVMVTGVISGLVSAALFYVIGRVLGGSRDWRAVFSVMLHAHVPAIIVSLALAGPMFLLVSEMASVDPDTLSGRDESEMVEALAPLAGYVMLVAVMGIASAAWVIIVTVKAIRTVHGFGTLKSFGLWILVLVISVVVIYPLG